MIHGDLVDGEITISLKRKMITVNLRYVAKKLLSVDDEHMVVSEADAKALAAGYLVVEHENALLKATLAAMTNGMSGKIDLDG